MKRRRIIRNLILTFENFTAFIIVLGFAAIAAAQSGVYVEYLRRGGVQCRSNCRTSVRPQQDCPVVNCPPAVRDEMCGAPDCTLAGNRLRLHPTTDPNFFFQCAPVDAWGTIRAILRPCG